MSEHDRISVLIKSQVPFFVRNDHSQFVTFLEKYYEYLEQSDKVIARTKTVQDLQNIDITPDEFADHLYDTFMRYIPRNIDADKRLLLKHIKDFYRAKGTEKSIRFLMNALYHAEASFYYPKKDVLRASDGKWYIQRSLRVSDTFIDGQSNNSISGLERYVGTNILGLTSNARAIVERVERIFEQGAQVDEIILSNIDGEFENGETIFANFDNIEATSNITSNIFSGLINSITVENGGSNYQVGDPVIIVSTVGSGAVATVAQVTTGNIASIAVLTGGAGYRANDNLLIIPVGPGSGGSARIDQVITNEEYHPNTYNIMHTTIASVANITINAASYGINLNNANANTSMNTAANYWRYANTGPAGTVIVLNSGENYSAPPSLSVVANTSILQLGILGRMEIIDGGVNYHVNDEIQFVNVPNCLGTGARAKVTEVDGGVITEVRFVEQPGHIIGGAGYSLDALPMPLVLSNTGNGANIICTALLGTGATMRSDQSTIGTITRIVVQSRGRDYDQNTSIDLTQSGDGLANASLSILEGILTYPGRWLNDDGQLDSYNFLQDRDFYQSFSYVIRSRESISKYRSVLKNLTHPAGTKMFGEFLYDNVLPDSFSEDITVDTEKAVWYKRPYLKTGNTVNVTYGSAVAANSNVGIEFISGNVVTADINGVYLVVSSGPNWLSVNTDNSMNATGNVEIRLFD